MLQNTPSYQRATPVPSNTNGSLTQDVLKLFKTNKMLSEQLNQILFNVHSYNNRLLMGNMRSSISS